MARTRKRKSKDNLPAKIGRPLALTLDEQMRRTIKSLSGIQCTTREIAAVCGVSHTCFQEFLRREPEANALWEAGQEAGKKSLRRWQYAQAKKGNVIMLIWLGKQYLGQRDKHETEVKVTKSDDLETIRARLDEMRDRIMPPDERLPVKEESLKTIN